MARQNIDPLKEMRAQVEKEILKKYRTVEQFCWEKNLNKATLSNFFHNKKDFRISTVYEIARALGKKLVVKLDD